MKKLALAALVVMIACPGVYAQETPVTLGQLHAELGELLKQPDAADRPLQGLSIVIGPIGATRGLVGQLQSNESDGYTTLAVLNLLQGKCSDNPPLDPDLLNDLGFYVIQFCDHSIKNWADGDFHLLAGSGGQLGGLIGSHEFNCKNPYDSMMMTLGGRNKLCRD